MYAKNRLDWSTFAEEIVKYKGWLYVGPLCLYAIDDKQSSVA